MKIVRTSMALCVECLDGPPEVDGECECAVDMRVCDCDVGPLNDGEVQCRDCRGRTPQR